MARAKITPLPFLSHVTIARKSATNEWRVAPRFGTQDTKEAKAYYTNDREDAINTATAIQAELLACAQRSLVDGTLMPLTKCYLIYTKEEMVGPCGDPLAARLIGVALCPENGLLNTLRTHAGCFDDWYNDYMLEAGRDCAFVPPSFETWFTANYLFTTVENLPY